MSKVDPVYYIELLSFLSDKYPNPTGLTGEDLEKLYANASYLEEHGLITFQSSKDEKLRPVISMAKITAKGIDFIDKNGGITAIEKIVTFKPDVDAFLPLLEDLAQYLPEPEKSNFLKSIGKFATPIVQGAIQGAIQDILKRWIGLQ